MRFGFALLATTLLSSVAIAQSTPAPSASVLVPGGDIPAKFVPPQSTAVAYRRGVFHRIGMFDEAFDACEDVEFNHRVFAAGLTCYFAPAVKVAYHPRGTLPALFSRR